MTFTSSIKVEISVEEYAKKFLSEKLPLIVKKHALNIQTNAAMNAPVLTGALRNSLQARPIDERNWVVEDGVEYGRAQELGYPPRNLPAKHFLGNASEKEADSFFDEVRGAME